ncbi:MAG TPA: hypothetical protein VF062_06915 [Candidatus Limnocylindrales bacterium]
MTSPVFYRLEYVSGVFIPYGGDIVISVINKGTAQGVVRAVGFVRETKDFDSDVDVPLGGPANGIVAPGEVWAHARPLNVSGSPYWVSIRVTSRRLVPSIMVRRLSTVEGDGDDRRVLPYLQIWPGDFAEFELPFVPDGGDVIDPDVIGPVKPG